MEEQVSLPPAETESLTPAGKTRHSHPTKHGHLHPLKHPFAAIYNTSGASLAPAIHDIQATHAVPHAHGPGIWCYLQQFRRVTCTRHPRHQRGTRGTTCTGPRTMGLLRHLHMLRRFMLGRDVLCMADAAAASCAGADAGGGLQDTAAGVVAHGSEADGDIRISRMTRSACAVS